MHSDNFDINQLKQNIIDSISKCVRCRFCFSKCPVYQASEGWVTQGASGITQALYYGIKLNKVDTDIRDILVRCTTCKSCEDLCERIMAGVSLVDAIIEGRQLVIEEGVNPPKGQQNALESLQLRGNPYGKQPSKRLEWTKGQRLNVINDDQNNVTSLYYVGCTACYDERVQKVSRSIAAILTSTGKEFGIFQNEKCSGDPARVIGERPLFEMLAEENAGMIKKAGIRQIITTSPHDYHCFKNEYPEEIKSLEILHYTELFAGMIDENVFKFHHRIDKKIVFHDPCYLGRYHKVFDAPRKILCTVPGVEFLEMDNCREDSICCGGGGGRMWVDIDETTRTSETRVKEALKLGAQVIATACPFCLIHLEDAVKVLNEEDNICVMDISEIMKASLCLPE